MPASQSPTQAHTAPRVFALAMLNSSLDDAEIISFLDALKTSGYEGICLHPRDGLRVPYATREYWARTDHIIALARERGFEVWHYDEFPFPSGMAGGTIPADDPSSVVRALSFEILDLSPNSDGLIEVGSESLLTLLRYRIDENGRKQNVRDVTQDCGAHLDTWAWGEWHNRFYTGTLHVHEELHERGIADRYTRAYKPSTPLESDEKLLAVKIVTPRGRAGLPGRVDLTRPEITDRFLNQIYARLAELSDTHNLQNTPVFQDEVTFGATWIWNAEIENRLRPLWGEHFARNLAALHAPDVEGWENARVEFRAACQEAFERNWFERVAEYCRAHNLQMTGHLAGEESILGHTQLMGDAFKNLRHFDVPGFDIISSTMPDDLNRSSGLGVKIVQSAAWMENRKTTMAEVFGAHGFHNDGQKNRNALAWLALHDITRVFDHSCYQSSKSIRKYDAPPVNTRFNPLQIGREDLWQWHNRFADLLEEYSFHPQTLILFPVESLSRFCTDEAELWREEVSLLETWFHYAFAASLDAILLPSHRLHEVETREDGFHFSDHVFENFIVPPVASMYEETWRALEKFARHPHFSWCVARASSSASTQDNIHNIKVFDENGEGQKTLAAQRVFACNEAELWERKAAWFDELFDSPLQKIRSQRMILKSRRVRESGESLIVVLNPHDDAVPIEVPPAWEEFVAPNDVATTEYSGAGALVIAPRDVLIFRENPPQKARAPRKTRVEIHPASSQIRFVSPNYLSLKSGTIQLEGFPIRDFAPAPVSSLWNLPVEYAQSDAVFAPPYSRQVLARPLRLETTFSVFLDEDLCDKALKNAALQDLTVLLDDESSPQSTRVFWDGVLLERGSADVFDRGNTVYLIPAELLKAGAHRLGFEGTVSHAAQGILERPILIGKFLARSIEPRSTPRLRAMPGTAQSWVGDFWPQLGMPEGFGPLEYSFVFRLDESQFKKTWRLQLSPCIGVAEIFINEVELGRSSWEPHVLQARALHTGENRVRVRLHGSWNNVFSSLNRLQNGLSSAPVLWSDD